MAESVLSKLVKTDKETKEHLESIDSNLSKVYKLQLKTEKREAKQAKRDAQRKKRSGGDFLQNLALPEKEKKKAKKSWLESLGEFFKSMGGGLLAGLGGLLGPLFKAGGPIAGLVTGFFKDIFKDKDILGAIGKQLVKLIKNPAFIGAAVTVVSIDKGVKEQKAGYDNNVNQENTRRKKEEGKKPMTKEEETQYLTDLVIKQGLAGGLAVTPGVQSMLMAQIAEREKNRKGTESQRIIDYLTEHKGKGIFGTTARIPGEEKAGPTQDLAVATRNVISYNETIRKLRKHLEKEKHGTERHDELTATIARFENKKLRWQLKQSAAAIAYEEMLKNPVQKQTGGPLLVPGTGSGDKVPMMLPEGSFVMNRNAASMGYQTGGIPKFQSGGMIPTLLEPGEHVYGPGQWDASHVMMNNQIPRFQTGGFVGTSRDQMVDTGDVDGKGRPILLAPAAAAAWKKMKNDGMPMIPGNVANVWRNEAEYNRLISEGYTPAANSYHNHGEAADIHGEMNRWIRANGAKYGWVANDYRDSHGGHFEFHGAGARGRGGGTTDQDGGAGGASENSTTSAGGISGFMSSLGGIGGAVGQFMSGAMGIIGDTFGPEMGGVLNSIFGGGSGVSMGGDSGGGNGGGNGGDGSLSDSSAPLSGTTAGIAKQMYNYIKNKGYSDAQAKGIVANIHRESTFDIDAVGDNGTSFGLFQWHAGRGARMKAAVNDWANNWQGQIDYALKEHVGPQYKGATSGMSAKDAAYWWMNKWEIPQDRARGGPNHRKMNGFIDAYTFQEGGRVSRAPHSTNVNQRSRQQALQRQIARVKGPNIQVVPYSDSSPSKAHNPGAQNQPPVLSAYPSNSVALDLANRTSIGGVF